MITSTYDPCFMITTEKDKFGIVGIQTDDTLILADETYSAIEDDELIKAKFLAKPKEKLTHQTKLIYNGFVLTEKDDMLFLSQKEQGKKIKTIDISSLDFKRRYIEQRARGAYIASICQPEAAFDLSVAAQHQNLVKDKIISLKKRLGLQILNLERSFKYTFL